MKNIAQKARNAIGAGILYAAVALSSGCGATHGCEFDNRGFVLRFGGNGSAYSLTEGPTDRFVDTRAYPADAQPYADPQHKLGNRNPNDGAKRVEAMTPFMQHYIRNRNNKGCDAKE